MSKPAQCTGCGNPDPVYVTTCERCGSGMCDEKQVVRPIKDPRKGTLGKMPLAFLRQFASMTAESRREIDMSDWIDRFAENAVKEISRRVAEDLCTNGFGDARVDRLVQVSIDGKDLGGWSERAIQMRVNKVIRSYFFPRAD